MILYLLNRWTKGSARADFVVLCSEFGTFAKHRADFRLFWPIHGDLRLFWQIYICGMALLHNPMFGFQTAPLSLFGL